MCCLQPCPIPQNGVVSLLERPALALIHQKWVVCCAFGCGMLLEGVKEVGLIAFLSQSYFNVGTDERFDKDQVVPELCLCGEPSCSS